MIRVMSGCLDVMTARSVNSQLFSQVDAAWCVCGFDCRAGPSEKLLKYSYFIPWKQTEFPFETYRAHRNGNFCLRGI